MFILKKRLTSTNDLETLVRWRQILDSNNIKYDVRANSLNTSSFLGMGRSRGRTGSFGVDLSLNYTYTLYLNKKDFDYGKYLLSIP